MVWCVMACGGDDDDKTSENPPNGSDDTSSQETSSAADGGTDFDTGDTETTDDTVSGSDDTETDTLREDELILPEGCTVAEYKVTFSGCRLTLNCADAGEETGLSCGTAEFREEPAEENDTDSDGAGTDDDWLSSTTFGYECSCGAAYGTRTGTGEMFLAGVSSRTACLHASEVCASDTPIELDTPATCATSFHESGSGDAELEKECLQFQSTPVAEGVLVGIRDLTTSWCRKGEDNQWECDCYGPAGYDNPYVTMNFESDGDLFDVCSDAWDYCTMSSLDAAAPAECGDAPPSSTESLCHAGHQCSQSILVENYIAVDMSGYYYSTCDKTDAEDTWQCRCNTEAAYRFSEFDVTAEDGDAACAAAIAQCDEDFDMVLMLPVPLQE